MAGSRQWWWGALLITLAAPCGAAVDDRRPPLVLHVDDRAGASPDEIMVARHEVEQVFAATGVAVRWSGEGLNASAAGGVADADGSRHVMVRVVNIGGVSTPEPTGCMLGFAARKPAIVTVFYNRVVEQGRRHAVDARIVLGRVMAHEIGHVLLPPDSHSRSGIMRATLDLAMSNPDRFTDPQARIIRDQLANPAASR